MRMEPTWHTYWVNPGDSGIPPSIEWKLPPGWKAGPILWPTPEKLEQGGLVSYGYEHEALLLIRLTPPANAEPGSSADLKGLVSWLICQRGCVPASEQVEVKVSLGTETANQDWSARLNGAEAVLPAPATAELSARIQGHSIVLNVASTQTTSGAGASFYPLDETVEPAAPQPVSETKAGFQVDLKISQFANGKIIRLRGLLVPPKGVKLGDRPGAVVVDIPVNPGGEKSR